MYKVLPQMHRLADQVCLRYGLEVDAIVVDSENFGSIDRPLSYYIVKLKPNVREWSYLSCRPVRTMHAASKSFNNVTVVALTGPASDDVRVVIPSWRGKLVEPDKLEEHRYHIKQGYMLISAGVDYLESELIERYERGYMHICPSVQLLTF